MTTTTQVTHKATLIHKADQIYDYRSFLLAKNKEATNPSEAWVVNLDNKVVLFARTRKDAQGLVDTHLEASDNAFELAPVVAPKKAKLTKAEVKANMLKEATPVVEAVAETFTVLEVSEAMTAVNTVACWYDKPEYYKPINYGVQQGWLVRPSTTQVYWTDEGALAYKATQEVKVEIAEATPDVDVLYAMTSLSFGLKTTQPDYKKSPMEEGLEFLIPAVEMLEREVSKTDKTGKVRIFMSKKLFNKPQYRKQIRTLSESLKEKYGTEIVVTLYDINQYMTMADNRIEAHEFVLAFHYLNGWVSKDATTATKALLQDY